MKFGAYVRDKMYAIVWWAVLLVIVGLILMAFKVEVAAMIAVLVVFAVSGVGILAMEYWQKRKFYRELLGKVERLDQAYLVLETMREPEFYEGRLVWDALRAANKSMAENVRREREQGRSFREYVEMWIHEVKRPLANLELVVENLWKTPETTVVGKKNGKMGKMAEKGEKEMKNVEKREKYGMGLGDGKAKIQRNLRELGKYVEQVLYFVRSENAEKDYLIREVDLGEVVKKVGMKNMEDFLDNGVEFEVEITDCKVYSDAKWLEFVMNQMVDNSIKYRREKGAKVVIRGWKEGEVIDGVENRTENGGNRTKSEKNRTILEVEDNGIGIAAGDLPMVFEKTFTGENGRKGAGAKINENAERGIGMTSTGMGLYIAKNLCEKLGHRIEIESEEGRGTKVQIVFEDSGFYEVVK